MKDLFPYSPKSLEEMFALRKGDIILLIESEGVPIFSPIREEFIGYLPSLGSAFRLDVMTAEQCLSNIDLAKMDIDYEEAVVSLRTLSPKIPPTAFLFNNIWVNQANTVLNIDDENFLLLVSERLDSPVYFGHQKAVERLAINFEGDIKLIKVNNFIRRQN